MNNADDVAHVPPNSANSSMRVLPLAADPTGDDGTSTDESRSSRHLVHNRYVVNHSWDNVESNFLICHTKGPSILRPRFEGNLVA